MKLTEKQAFEIMRFILDKNNIEIDSDELSDFVMIELINKEFSDN